MQLPGLKYAGFVLRWNFFADDPDYPDMEELQDQGTVPAQVWADILTVLRILQEEELMFPTSAILDEKVEIAADSPEEFCRQLRLEVEKRKGLLSIERIAGPGQVYLESGERLESEDLVWVEDIRFFDRQISISTSKSIWVPVSINADFVYEWQPFLARLNASRLESALRRIQESLQMDVSPEPDELDREHPIWMKGFRLYANPEILKEEYADNPPGQDFEISDFLIDD